MGTKFFNSTALAESGVINASPAALREVTGFNNSVVVVYFQLFDKAVAPVNPDAPTHQCRVPPGATFEGNFRDMLRSFPAAGIAYGFSTTPDVFTAGAGAIGHVEAVYEG